MELTVTEIFSFEQRTKLSLPIAMTSVPAGFPSPADDYMDKKLDLNEYLIQHPAATFFVRVKGESMIQAGIHSGDILIVDRAIEPDDGKVVIAAIDGELTVKRILKRDGKLYLAAENPDYNLIEVSPEQSFIIWGVVTYVIHKVE
ncbi:MAG: translesion error-prone DNA polymerase V autoproteolytic subunit [Firmicutes bacterium]|jgi:DNA polymerase V|nr:translesion error-prone DNA polymerase V autoproteolytic subunit [Bacillota bacterium]